MMKRVDRYILRQLFIATVFLTCVLAGLITIIRSLRLIDFVVNRGLPLRVLFELTILLLPTFIAIVLPIALFAAVLWVYSRLTSDSELVVLRAAGMGPLALAKPALQMALLVVALAYYANLVLSPSAYSTFKDLSFFYRNSYGSVLLQEGRFNSPTDGLTVYIRERRNDGALLGIFVHDSRDPTNPVTLVAERGLLERTDTGARVILFNGNRQEIDTNTGRLLLLYFDQNSVDLEILATNPNSRWRNAEERTLGELFNPGDSDAALFYRDELRAEGHRRLASPLSAITFTLIALAALLSGEFNRSGQTYRILAAVGTVIVLQAALLGTASTASKNIALVPLLYVIPLIGGLGGLRILRRESRRRGRYAASPA